MNLLLFVLTLVSANIFEAKRPTAGAGKDVLRALHGVLPANSFSDTKTGAALAGPAAFRARPGAYFGTPSASLTEADPPAAAATPPAAAPADSAKAAAPPAAPARAAGVVQPLVTTAPPTAPAVAADDTTPPPATLAPETTVEPPPPLGSRINPTGKNAWEEAVANYGGKKYHMPKALALDKVLDTTRGWAGLAAIGKDIFLAPSSSDQIIVVNVNKPDFPRLMAVQTNDMMPSSMPTAGIKTIPMGPMKWCAAVAVKNKVYFAPMLSDKIMILDAEAWHASREDPLQNASYLSSVSLDPSQAKGGTPFFASFGTQKWLGASAIGKSALVLGPSYQGNVPMLSKLQSPNGTEVSMIDAQGLAGQSFGRHLPLGGEALWMGSVSIGKKVYYAPSNAGSILVLDILPTLSPGELAERAFKSGYKTKQNVYQIRTDKIEKGGPNVPMKWFGGAQYEGRIYFAPHNHDSILVVNASTDRVRSIPVEYFAGRQGKWRGATVLDDKMYFAPYNADGILILDLKTEAVHMVGTRLLSNRTAKWMGAVAVDKRVYFSPYRARKMLIYDTIPMDAKEPAEKAPEPPQSLFEERGVLGTLASSFLDLEYDEDDFTHLDPAPAAETWYATAKHTFGAIRRAASQLPNWRNVANNFRHEH